MKMLGCAGTVPRFFEDAGDSPRVFRFYGGQTLGLVPKKLHDLLMNDRFLGRSSRFEFDRIPSVLPALPIEKNADNELVVG